jgi:hypothetical protein
VPARERLRCEEENDYLPASFITVIHDIKSQASLERATKVVPAVKGNGTIVLSATRCTRFAGGRCKGFFRRRAFPVRSAANLTSSDLTAPITIFLTKSKDFLF